MKVRSIFSMLVCLVGISACYPQYVRYPTHSHINIDFHHFDRTHLLDKLRKNDIYVIQLGDHVRIIIPSDRLFYFDTAKLIPNYYPTLECVSAFISHYGAACPIEVAAYTDNVRDFASNKDLSIRQAKAVAGFLWSHGISILALRPMGFGPCCDVANNYTSRGSYYNRRVEIRFVVPL